ncbi:uncharacterized protein B0T23DRAFT_377229 [Neurospora hispaniola]|uniref:Secreted protein n=1 Tax=Neurospora hispaniola TaxID=588809 RepID=A0AAJ0IA26_9PEZI|nr:hypothetical protein B0T23DRAFT_377229 [Neurospora hispaniola]
MSKQWTLTDLISRHLPCVLAIVCLTRANERQLVQLFVGASFWQLSTGPELPRSILGAATMPTTNHVVPLKAAGAGTGRRPGSEML